MGTSVQKPLVNWMLIVFFLSVAGFAIFERFHGLMLVGSCDSDTNAYFRTLMNWHQGIASLPDGYRPMAHLWHYLTSLVVGLNDSVLKFTSAIFDLLLAFVLFFFAKTQTKSWRVAGSIGLAYLYMGYSLHLARSDSLHSAAGFWLFLSLIFLIQSIDKPRGRASFAALLASGLLFSLSFNTHPSVVFALPGIALFYVLYGLKNSKKLSAKKLALDAGLYTLGFLSLIALIFAVFGGDQVILAWKSGAERKFGEQHSVLNLPVQIFQSVFAESFSNEIAIFLLVFVILVSVFLVMRRLPQRLSFILLVVPLGFVLSYAFVVQTTMVTRVFFPFIPIIVFFFFDYLWQFGAYFLKPRLLGSLTFMLGLLAFIYFNRPNLVQGSSPSGPQEACVLREISDYFKQSGIVPSKLIWAPLSAYRINDALNSPIYFDGNSAYLIDLPGGSLNEVFEKEGADFVFLFERSTYIDIRTFSLWRYEPTIENRMKAFYGQSFVSSPQLEIDFLKGYLSKNFEFVLSTSKGSLYRIR